MENLNYYLQKAREGKYALAHFNFASAEQLRAIVQAFQNVVTNYQLPITDYALMVGTSEGEGKFIGHAQARALVDAWKKETGLPLFLNADHHKSFESCKQDIDADYDTVLIDASKIPFDENVSVTKKVVEYMKSKNPNGTVEGELGYLRGSSQVQENIEISPDDFTKPGEAKKFVDQTGVDRLAVAIGNIHGITTNQEMSIDIDLLKEIVSVVPRTYLVLHGGSGLAPEDFKNAIKAGVTNVHINTDIRIAYRKGIEESFASDPKQVAPYKYLDKAVEGMQAVAEEKIRIFFRIDNNL